MSELFSKAKEQLLLWWLVIFYVLLFTFLALGNAIVTALVGATWNQLDTQGKFMICVMVFINWATVMIAFINRAISRAQAGQILISPEDMQLLSQAKKQQQEQQTS